VAVGVFGAKQPMNNEASGKMKPPNLYLYLDFIPKGFSISFPTFAAVLKLEKNNLSL
jgi:hypothetical protein